MNCHGNIRHYHGRLDFAPFVGVLFLMLPLLLFHTSLQRGFKPGIEVDIDLPVSVQKTGVSDPSLSVAVDAAGILYFRNRQILGLARSITVKKTEEGMPLVDLVINRVEELDSNLVFRSLEQGRVQLNGELAQPEAQLKPGHKIELDVPSSELLWPQVEKAIEQGGLQPGEVSLLIQADKAVRHEVIIDLCTMAGKMGIGRVLLASRPPDFVRPFDPELKTEP